MKELLIEGTSTNVGGSLISPGIVDDYSYQQTSTPMPEFIDPVFAKTSPIRSFSITENDRFGHVFVKTGSINSGTDKSTD